MDNIVIKKIDPEYSLLQTTKITDIDANPALGR